MIVGRQKDDDPSGQPKSMRCYSNHQGRIAPRALLWIWILGFSRMIAILVPAAQVEVDLSPCALATNQRGHALYIACATSHQVIEFDITKEHVTRTISLPGQPTGLAVSSGNHLFVTCDEPGNCIQEIDLVSGRVVSEMPTVPGVCSPVLSSQGRLLYVCNRFAHRIDVVDWPEKTVTVSLPVVREPISAVLSADGRWLFVANHLPSGPANVDQVSAGVSVIDTAGPRVAGYIPLPNGSTSLRGMAISPDGRWVGVTHNVARFKVPATQVEQGWMNSGALTLIDASRQQWFNTVLLDDPTAGAANPWAVGWTADGASIVVTHSGTHEISVIAAQAMVEKLLQSPGLDRSQDLEFLQGLKRRVKLEGNGPRALALVGSTAYVAEFFTDSLSVVDIGNGQVQARTVLGKESTPSLSRWGERLFHDATLCHQGWQSCASCHPDGRTDGLNWDLLNDGIGNPKNTRSLLLAMDTPPAMSRGIRETAEAAVRSGLRQILFALRPESEALAIDAYLRSLKPVPSPCRIQGELSPAAQRGKEICEKPSVGCARCHCADLYTNLKSYDVGTGEGLDGIKAAYDTPSLRECWRTAPYLHDGSAATLHDVLRGRNPSDRHGRTSDLTEEQINDLEAYVLSL